MKHITAADTRGLPPLNNFNVVLRYKDLTVCHPTADLNWTCPVGTWNLWLTSGQMKREACQCFSIKWLSLYINSISFFKSKYCVCFLMRDDLKHFENVTWHEKHLVTGFVTIFSAIKLSLSIRTQISYCIGESKIRYSDLRVSKMTVLHSTHETLDRPNIFISKA